MNSIFVRFVGAVLAVIVAFATVALTDALATHQTRVAMGAAAAATRTLSPHPCVKVYSFRAQERGSVVR
jgi:hypothetical protein